MKKLITYCILNIFLFFSIKSFGFNSLNILKNRIKKINNFHASFVQKIVNFDGQVIQSGKGELWIKRPNFLNFHMFNPEEFFLISDGNNLWFYVPTINQVTVYHLNDNNFFNNFFLKLLSNHDLSEYTNYKLFQEKDWFYLKPIIKHELNLKEFHIKITEKGIINRLIIIEENGQKIDYSLYNQNVQKINTKKFSFFVTKDMQLDDQRK